MEGHSTGAAGREWWLVITPGQREQRLEGEAEAPLHLLGQPEIAILLELEI